MGGRGTPARTQTISASQPACLISDSSDSRTDMSSSTTKTIAESSGIVRIATEREDASAKIYLNRNAAFSASRRAVPLKGLNRHSTAPSAITRRRMLLSPLARDKDDGNHLSPLGQFLPQVSAQTFQAWRCRAPDSSCR